VQAGIRGAVWEYKLSAIETPWMNYNRPLGSLGQNRQIHSKQLASII